MLIGRRLHRKKKGERTTWLNHRPRDLARQQCITGHCSANSICILAQTRRWKGMFHIIYINDKLNNSNDNNHAFAVSS